MSQQFRTRQAIQRLLFGEAVPDEELKQHQRQQDKEVKQRQKQEKEVKKQNEQAQQQQTGTSPTVQQQQQQQQQQQPSYIKKSKPKSKSTTLLLVQHLLAPTFAFIFFLITLTLLFVNLGENNIVTLSLYGSVSNDEDLFVSNSNNTTTNNETVGAPIVISEAQRMSEGVILSFQVVFILALILNMVNFLDFFLPLCFVRTNNSELSRLYRFFSASTNTVVFKWFYLANIILAGVSGFFILLSFITMVSWSSADPEFSQSSSSSSAYGKVITFWLFVMFSSAIQIFTSWYQFVHDDCEEADDNSAEEENGKSNLKDVKALRLRMMINPNTNQPNSTNKGDADEEADRNLDTEDGNPEIFEALQILSGNGNYSASAWRLHKILAVTFGIASFVFHLITFSLLCAAYANDHFVSPLVIASTSTSTSNILIQRLNDGVIISLITLLVFATIISAVNALEWILLSSDDPKKLIAIINTMFKKNLQIYSNRFVGGTHVLFCGFLVLSTLISSVQTQSSNTSSSLVIAFWVFLGFCCIVMFSCTWFFVPTFLLGSLMRELLEHERSQKLEKAVEDVFFGEEDYEDEDLRPDHRDAGQIIEVCRSLKREEKQKELKRSNDEDSDTNDDKSKKKGSKSKSPSRRNKQKNVVIKDEEVEFLDPSFIPRYHVLPQYLLHHESSPSATSASNLPRDHRRQSLDNNDNNNNTFLSEDLEDVDQHTIDQEQQRKISAHVKKISREIVDLAYLDPTTARHWINLAFNIQHWQNCSAFIFWQRFEKFAALVEQHKTGDKKQRRTRMTHLLVLPSNPKISPIPRLLGNFHPFPVLSSKPSQSREAQTESAFPSSEKLLSAVSFLASSTDTVPLLFHIFNSSAFAHRDRRLKLKSGCYHTTFNFSGMWRHTFVDSIMPLQPPLQEEDVLIEDEDQNDENENEKPKEPASSAVNISNDDDKDGLCSCLQSNQKNKKSEKEERRLVNSIRRRLLAPNCKLDHRDIYLPVIQKSLAKLSGSYASSSLDIGVDSLNELHDLTGAPIERLPWPKNDSSSSSTKSLSSFNDHENATLLLTSAFVQLEVALLRHEGGRVYEASIQPVALLTKRDSGKIVRVVAAAGAEVDPYRAKEFEQDVEYQSLERKRKVHEEKFGTAPSVDDSAEDGENSVDREEKLVGEENINNNSTHKQAMITTSYGNSSTTSLKFSSQQQQQQQVPEELLDDLDDQQQNNQQQQSSITSQPPQILINSSISDSGVIPPPQYRNSTDIFEGPSPATPGLVPVHDGHFGADNDNDNDNDDETKTREPFSGTDNRSDQQNNKNKPSAVPTFLSLGDEDEEDHDQNKNNRNPHSSFASAGVNLSQVEVSSSDDPTSSISKSPPKSRNTSGKNGKNDRTSEDDHTQKPSAVREGEDDEKLQPKQNVGGYNNNNKAMNSSSFLSETSRLVDDNLSFSASSKMGTSANIMVNAEEEEKENENDSGNQQKEKTVAENDNNHSRQLIVHMTNNAIDDDDEAKIESNKVRESIQKYICEYSTAEKEARRAPQVVRFVLIIDDDEEEENINNNKIHDEDEIDTKNRLVNQDVKRLLKIVDNDLISEETLREALEQFYERQKLEPHDIYSSAKNKSKTSTREENLLHFNAKYSKLNPSGNLVPIKKPLPLQFYCSNNNHKNVGEEEEGQHHYRALLRLRPDIRKTLTTQTKQHFYHNGLIADDDFSVLSLADAILLSKMKWMEWESSSSSSSSSTSAPWVVNLTKSFSSLGVMYVPIQGLLQDFSYLHPHFPIGKDRLNQEQIPIIQREKQRFLFDQHLPELRKVPELSKLSTSDLRKIHRDLHGGLRAQDPQVRKRLLSVLSKNGLTRFKSLEEQQKFLDAPTFEAIIKDYPFLALIEQFNYNETLKHRFASSSFSASPYRENTFFFSRAVTDVRLPNRFDEGTACSNWIMRMSVDHPGRTSIFVGLHQQDARKDVACLLSYGRRNNNNKNDETNKIPVCGCVYQSLIISVFRVVSRPSASTSASSMNTSSGCESQQQQNQQNQQNQENEYQHTKETLVYQEEHKIFPIQESSSGQFSSHRDLYLRLDLEKSEKEHFEKTSVSYLIVPRLQLSHEHVYVKRIRNIDDDKVLKGENSNTREAASEMRQFYRQRQQQQQKRRHNSSNNQHHQRNNNKLYSTRHPHNRNIPNNNKEQQQSRPPKTTNEPFSDIQKQQSDINNNNNNNNTKSSSSRFLKRWKTPFVETFETPTSITTKQTYTVLHSQEEDERQQQQPQKLILKEQVILTTKPKQVDFVFSLSVPRSTGLDIAHVLKHESLEEIEDREKRQEAVKQILESKRREEQQQQQQNHHSKQNFIPPPLSPSLMGFAATGGSSSPSSPPPLSTTALPHRHRHQHQQNHSRKNNNNKTDPWQQYLDQHENERQKKENNLQVETNAAAADEKNKRRTSTMNSLMVLQRDEKSGEQQKQQSSPSAASPPSFRPKGDHRTIYGSLLAPTAEFKQLVSQQSSETPVTELCKHIWSVASSNRIQGRSSNRSRNNNNNDDDSRDSLNDDEESSTTTSTTTHYFYGKDRGFSGIFPTTQQLHNEVLRYMQQQQSSSGTALSLPRDILLQHCDVEVDPTGAQMSPYSFNIAKFVRSNYYFQSDERLSHFFVKDLARDTVGALDRRKIHQETTRQSKSNSSKAQVKEEVTNIPYAQVDGTTKMN